MRIAYPSYAALAVIAIFFGLLVWLDDTPAAYTQEEPPTLHQLTNQHTKVASSHPSGFTELKGAVYFGLDEKSGLWKTDGTPEGTALVKDLSITASSIRRVGDELYFVGYDDANHSTLWRSDGTAEGTRLIKEDLFVYYYEFVALGNHVYFTAYDSSHGAELWQSDGTPEGTSLFADLLPGAPSAYPRSLTVSNNMLYFTAYNEQSNITLWQSDGTAAGTHVVPGAPQRVDALTVMQNALYFVGYTLTTGKELWRYGPGDQAPSLVADLAPNNSSADIDELVVRHDRLFFVATDGTHGHELWQSDGTAAGTQLVKDITSGSNDTNIASVTVVNDLVYFTVDFPVANVELWKSDGTAAGTLPIKPSVPEASSFYPYNLTAMNGQLYFLVSISSTERKLWKSDGTAEGTLPLTTIRHEMAYSNLLTAIGDLLYFSAYDDLHGNELWVSDGTTAGTAFVKDLNTAAIGPYFSDITPVNQRLYFITASPNEWGPPRQLWMSPNGTAQAVLVDDQMNTTSLQSIGNDLFISKRYDATKAGLWKHDGSTTTLQLVKHFTVEGPSWFMPLNQQLFFLASDSRVGSSAIYDLWRSDGTPAGTTKLITGTVTAAAPIPQLVFHNRLWATRGNEIWLLDGTPTGISHFVVNGLQGYIRRLVSTPDAVYFMAVQSTDIFTENHTLWRSDGTPEGTHQLTLTPEATYFNAFFPTANGLYLIASTFQGAELWYKANTAQTFTSLVRLTHGAYYPNYSELTQVNGQLFFTADDGTHGPELWRSDGTPAGTGMVKDIIPTDLADVPSAYPGPLFAFGDLLYFGIDDGVHGQELWRSDGTPAGTQLFQDIKPNAGSSSPGDFMARTGLFFFAANDGVHGRELWQSDGTAAGTHLVTDLYPGPASGVPRNRTIVDNILYFTGNNGLDGEQLFSLQTTVIPLALPTAAEPQAAPHHLYLPLVR